MPAPATLGLLVGAEVAPELRGLIAALATRFRLADGSSGNHDCYLYFRDVQTPPDTAPVLAWVESDQDLASEPVRRASVIAASSTQLLGRAAAPGRSTVFVGSRSVGDRVPVSAWVRERVRAGHELPQTLIVRIDASGTLQYQNPDGDRAELVEVPASATETAIALASAVIATTEEALWAALAWGCPTVTTPELAALLGARDQHEVIVVAARREELFAATELAADLPAAARLAWAGRRLAERHDPSFAAGPIADLLVPNRDRGPTRRLDEAMAELNTPVTAVIRSRLAGFTSGLAVATPSAGGQE